MQFKTPKIVTIHINDQLNAVDMTTDVFPGFATDLQAQWVAYGNQWIFYYNGYCLS